MKLQKQQSGSEDGRKDWGSSSKCYYKFAASAAAESVEQQPRMPPIRRNTPTTLSIYIYTDVCFITNLINASRDVHEIPVSRNQFSGLNLYN